MAALAALPVAADKPRFQVTPQPRKVFAALRDGSLIIYDRDGVEALRLFPDASFAVAPGVTYEQAIWRMGEIIMNVADRTGEDLPLKVWFERLAKREADAR
jgi:hypothetical protein